MSSSKTWFVYLIECVTAASTRGSPSTWRSRFKAHRDGRGARYMRLHPPLRMLAAEAHPDRSAASKAEYRIKQLTAAGKSAPMQQP
jgi:putative endonuclease